MAVCAVDGRQVLHPSHDSGHLVIYTHLLIGWRWDIARGRERLCRVRHSQRNGQCSTSCAQWVPVSLAALLGHHDRPPWPAAG